jgi:transposase-like protein
MQFSDTKENAMELKPKLLDKLLEGVKTQEDLAGPGGLLKQITKALVERMLAGELTHHLGYEKQYPQRQKPENLKKPVW